MGEFNSRTGRKKDNMVVWQFGEDVLNDNGTTLIEFYNLKRFLPG